MVILNRVYCAYFLSAFSPKQLVITGYNTDIEYEGVTYHVQTEDKGLETPLILSLVYDRGTILASKRSHYDDLIDLGFDAKVLSDRLQKQHKIICAAIRAGRIDDLKRMTMKEANARQNVLIAQKEIKIEKTEIKPKAEEAAKEILKPQEAPKAAEEIKAGKEDFFELQLDEAPEPKIIKEAGSRSEPPAAKAPPKEEPIPKPAQKLKEEAPREKIEIKKEAPAAEEEVIIIDEVQIIEEEIILPAEAVEIIADFAHAEAPEDKFSIEILNETPLRGGDRKTLNIMAKIGDGGVSGASVMVKILGSAFRPLIFHAKTDSNGIAIVHLQLPHFRSGRAAILIKAMSAGEEVELRRVIAQG